MTRQRPFDELLGEWLEEGPTDAPPVVLDTVLAAFPRIPQRRGLMRRRYGAARALVAVAASVATLGVLGAVALGWFGADPRPPLIGGAPIATPSVAPASPSATSVPTVTLPPRTDAPPPVDVDAVIEELQAYGAEHPDEFGGLYIDNANGGIPTILFTARLAEHEAALAERLSAGARFAVRSTPTTQARLYELMERIAAARDELERERIAVISAGSNEIEGRVEVQLSTERPDAVAFMEKQYGPLVRATVLDPTGAYLKEPGSLTGTVVDADGQPVRARIEHKPLFADIGLDAMGRASGPDGRFAIQRILPGRWEIRALADGYVPASVEVVVEPGESVEVTLVLEPAP